MSEVETPRPRGGRNENMGHRFDWRGQNMHCVRVLVIPNAAKDLRAMKKRHLARNRRMNVSSRAQRGICGREGD